jgi:ABC-type multidrug transport system fused ATPase/permease subunit
VSNNAETENPIIASKQAHSPVTSEEIDARLNVHTDHYLRLYIWAFALLFPIIGILDVMYLGTGSVIYVVARVLVSVAVLATWNLTRHSHLFRFSSVHLALVLGLLHTIGLYIVSPVSAGMFYLHLIAAAYLLTPALILWRARNMLFQWVFVVFVLFSAAWVIASIDVATLLVNGGAVLIVVSAAASLVPRIAMPYRRGVAETRIMLEKGHFEHVEAVLAEKLKEAQQTRMDSNASDINDMDPSDNTDAQKRPRFATFGELYAESTRPDRLPVEVIDAAEVMRSVLTSLQQETRTNNVQIDFIRPEHKLQAMANLQGIHQAFTGICTELIRYAKGMRLQVILEANEHFVLIHLTVSKSGVASDDLESIFTVLDILARKLRPYNEKISRNMFKAATLLERMNASLLHTDTGTDVRYARIALQVADPSNR